MKIVSVTQKNIIVIKLPSITIQCNKYRIFIFYMTIIIAVKLFVKKMVKKAFLYSK